MPPRRQRVEPPARTVSTRNRPATDYRPPSPLPTTTHSEGLVSRTDLSGDVAQRTVDQRLTDVESVLVDIRLQLAHLASTVQVPISQTSDVPNNLLAQETRSHVREDTVDRQIISYEASLMPYDGKIAWEEYLVHVQVMAEANEWSNARLGAKLASVLRGPALSVLADLPLPERTSFSHLTTALANRFGSHNQSLHFQELLEHRQQGKDEKLADLATDIERLVRGAFPNEPKSYRDKQGVRSFVRAIQDKSLSQSLAMSLPKTLPEALAKVQLAETLYKPTTTRGIHGFQDERCWGCNGIGHVRAKCPNTKGGKSEN